MILPFCQTTPIGADVSGSELIQVNTAAGNFGTGKWSRGAIDRPRRRVDWTAAEIHTSRRGTGKMNQYTPRQLDLFLDGGPARHEHDLIGALAERDFAASTQALQRLAAARPNHPGLSRFHTLIREGRVLHESSLEPTHYLELLERCVVPAAGVLGRRAAEFLDPFWSRLAELLDGRPFDPGAPECHESYAAGRVEDWSTVARSVDRETGWRKAPALVGRRLNAASHLGEATTALEALCRLCWDFPAEAPRYLGQNASFGHEYRAFEALDDALRVIDFPAWYALRSRRRLPLLDDTRNTTAPAVAAAVNALLEESPGIPDVPARLRLRKCHTALFEVYMSMRRMAGD